MNLSQGCPTNTFFTLKNLLMFRGKFALTFYAFFAVCVILDRNENYSVAANIQKRDAIQGKVTPFSEKYSDSEMNCNEDYSVSSSSSDENDTADSESMEQKVLPFNISGSADDVKFLLFRDARNENSSNELILDSPLSVARSGFKRQQMTVFLIHGFWSNSSSAMPVLIKRAYLEARLPYNIIVVDWGKLSSPDPKEEVYSSPSYPIVVKRNIPVVYNRVAAFIHFLVAENYATVAKIHVVGHSLGAHVSGGVGHVISSSLMNDGLRLSRITGLDPAGPLFQGVRVQRRLQNDDAEFVDVYHTAAGTLGSVRHRQGDVDFFPNGGHHQPNCVDFGQPLFFEADFGSCSHAFVVKIYAASITKKFTACQCDPFFIDYMVGNVCPGNCSVSVPAGEACPPSARGQFYFETSEDPLNEDQR